MGQYFNVKVQFRTESDNGKVKKETVNYLVDAMSVTEAEEGSASACEEGRGVHRTD